MGSRATFVAGGAELTVKAEADDYRPQTGVTAAPRRISIINAEQLDARIADRQAQIVRQLERALAAEQATREEVRRLQIEVRDVGGLLESSRAAVSAAEQNQRRVGRMLVDTSEGLATADRLDSEPALDESN